MERDISVCGKSIGGDQDSIGIGHSKPHFKSAALALVFKREWNHCAGDKKSLVGGCESVPDGLALRRLHGQVQLIVPDKVTVFLARIGFAQHQEPLAIDIDIAGYRTGI